MTDLAANGHVSSAYALACTSSVLALLVVWLIGERAIMGYEIWMWYGLIFALISNHHAFFNEGSVRALNMSGATVFLQLGIAVAAVCTCIFFYTGQYAKASGC